MSKLLCLLVLSTSATTALATIDFFFTDAEEPYGLKNQFLAFCHSFNDGYDFNHGYELLRDGGGNYRVPPYWSLDDIWIDPQTTPDAFVYIWARFNNEPPASQVGALDGISIKINGAYTGGGIWNRKIAFYQLDNRGINPPANKKWDGDADIFYNNPTGLIAIMATGQRNVTQDQPYNLYIGGSHRVFLLGAVRPTEYCDITIEVSAMHYSGTPTNPNPDPPVPAYLNVLHSVPAEPASLMLLAVAGLVLRRR